MIKKKLIIFGLIFLLMSTISAQNNGNKSQLAYQYFKDKEFDKAALLYKELYQQSQSKTYLTFLIKCYVEQKSFDEAEQTLKVEIKKNKQELSYTVMLGGIYKASGEDEKALKLFDKTISQLDGNRQQIINLANAFVSEREFGYAEKTYLKGRKLNRNEYSFAFELANVYYYSRDYQSMITQYLDVLEENESYINTVQNRLQSTVYNQDDGSLNDMLKRSLIERIQKSKQTTIYSELLIWLYLQEKSFDKAFLQVKAIDKRNSENGQRLIELGALALSNDDYQTSIDCYNYVLSYGTESVYYFEAKVGLLQAQQNKVIKHRSVSEAEIQLLLGHYKTLLQEMGALPEAIDLTIQYAHLLAFYGRAVEQGIDLLENMIEEQVLSPKQKSLAKLELADELLLNNAIWEATLFYSQVIQDNPNNEIGNEAQIRKAKLSYYSGDFIWAKGQLDVLKGSTSKLIANDAFYLSTMISDNLKDDTLTEPLRMFARADLFLFQNKKTEALALLDRIAVMFPKHSLADDILFKKGNTLVSIGQLEEAKMLYQEILDNYYTDILADNSLMALAEVYELQANPEKAVELYTQLLVDFPDSFFTTEARRRIVTFRDS